MKIPGYKRLIKEDFAGENQELIDKIGFIINSGFEPLYQALVKNLSIADNLNQQLVEVKVKVNASGTVLSGGGIKYTLKTSCQGIQVINCTPKPAAAPWITWNQTQTGVINLATIQGLSSGTEYTIKIILIGG